MSSEHEQLELALDFGGPASLVEPWEDALWSRGGIVDQVSDERMRQVEKWGQQDHPFFSVADREDGRPYYDASHYGFMARDLKRDNAQSVADGVVGWDTILLEEVHEALEQAGVNDDAYEKELVQVMAVCAAMIEANQRRRRANG